MTLRPNGGMPTVRILVVEDEEDIRVLLCWMCQRAGHDVDCAATVGEAAGLIALNNYDAATVDLLMPMAQHGMEVLEMLRLARVPRVVLLTGAGPGAIEEWPRIMELTTRVIHKPLTMPEVLRGLGIGSTS